MTFNEDDFVEVGPPVDTDAARVEAERRWPLPDQKFLDLYAGTYTLRGLDVEILKTGQRDGFIAGAAWQAAQAQPAPEADEWCTSFCGCGNDAAHRSQPAPPVTEPTP